MRYFEFCKFDNKLSVKDDEGIDIFWICIKVNFFFKKKPTKKINVTNINIFKGPK
jgi:hypothetical protein